MKMYKVYVDATCEGWQATDGSAKGEIIIVSPRKVIREKFTLSVEGLKQFINRFEFVAVQRALKLFGGKKNLTVYSDSTTAVGWARDPRVKWIPREENKAGQILEYEKERSTLEGIYSEI